MSTIQTNVRLYTLVEQALRRALEENRQCTFNQLWKMPDISNSARAPQQLRDILKTYRNKGLLTIVNVNPKDNEGAKVAYIWNPEGKALIATPKAKVDKAPSTTEVKKFAPLNTEEVELNFYGIDLVIGINPLTGRTRITIEKKP